MPLIQGGPPEWIWERSPEQLKWDLVPATSPEGQPVYELRANCGLEIMRLQFFTGEEVGRLASLLAEHGRERCGEGNGPGWRPGNPRPRRWPLFFFPEVTHERLE